MLEYNSKLVEERFDGFGMNEHFRLKNDVLGRISFAIHSYYLKKHINKNETVLEIGAGTGAFTKVLAECGAQITVSDISRIQLDLNKEIAEKEGYGKSIKEWVKADIVNLEHLFDEKFDHIVVYGGPFSFILDKRISAFQQCISLLKPKGKLIFSVPSLWGHMHDTLLWNLDIDVEKWKETVNTGDLQKGTYNGRPGNSMHLFTLMEIKEILSGNSMQLLDASSSGNLALVHADYSDKIIEIEKIWDEYLKLEIMASSSEGSCEMGDYIIIVAEKYNPSGYIK